MATDFDQFPLYDPLIREDSTRMSQVWVAAISTFHQTLIEYLSQYGIMLPEVSTDQRNSILTPLNGQIIYNTTVDAPQFFQASANTWRTVSFT